MKKTSYINLSLNIKPLTCFTIFRNNYILILWKHYTTALRKSDIFIRRLQLAWFGPYLNHGCYPIYLENKVSVHQKFEEVVQVVLEVDISQFENIQTGNIFLLKRLLHLISS